MNEEQREKFNEIITHRLNNVKLKGFDHITRQEIESNILYFLIGAAPLEYDVTEEEFGNFLLWCAEKTHSA